MADSRLKPCPFCGNKIETGVGFFTGAHAFSCNKCKMTVEFLWKELDVCIEAWNRRERKEEAKMADRDNQRLNDAIEQHISQWDGTIHGQCIKNMWENGTDYESICEAADIDYDLYV